MDDVAFRFAEPWLLWLLLLPAALWYRRPFRAGAGFAPFPLAAANLRPSRGPLIHRYLSVAALALLCLAAARPQYGRTIVTSTQDGRDLMLVIDLSGSMQIDDIADDRGQRVDRLAAVMQAATTFIDGRPVNDRIGLVLFAGEALTSCPLTHDRATLTGFLSDIEAQQRHAWRQRSSLIPDGTNIGLGIGTALRRLTRSRQSNDAGQAIVLITDGADTRQLPNWVDPREAARHAQRNGVRIYGIGVGDPDGTFTSRDRFTGRTIEQRLSREMLPDTTLLRRLAEISGGTALMAGDQAELTEVFTAIDRLETSPAEIHRREDYSDRFLLPLLLGSCLLALATLGEPRLLGGP